MVITEAAGKKFIDEIFRFLNPWTNDAPLNNSCYACITETYAKYHLKALERRLSLWEEGNITIQ